jgi:glycosyltransferase involved in cell wall biosynthesis
MSRPAGVAPAVRSVIVLPADPAAMRIGGIASFVRSFVRFAPDDFDVAMIGVSADLPARRWSTVEFEGRPMRFFPVLAADTGRRSRIPLALRFAWGLARHGQPDGLDGSILQFHRPGTDLVLRGAGAARLRFVHLTTGDLTQAGSESRWRLLGPVLGRIERDSLARMDQVYVVNAAAAEAYRQRWPEVARRIGFLPNFYDETIFKPLPETRRRELRSDILSTLGLPEDVRVVLFCGRLDGQKDPGLLVEAFVGLRSRAPGVALVIAGAGALESAVREGVRERGLEPDVRLLGTQPRDRLNELMNIGDLLALTSRFETGPTVGYEALATGLPVVTTPVGEVARIVRDTGAGRVVTDREPATLAAAMADVLREDIGRMRSRAVSAAAPFGARTVLEPIYAWHRQVRLPG